MNIEYLVVHCSDSPQGRGDDAKTIHQWHKELGWDGIGYHYVITEEGEIQAGRPEYWPGAHAKGINHKSLGICLIGKDIFTEPQLDALKNLLDLSIEKYPGAKVIGHRDVDTSKTCPNFDARKWYARVSCED